MSGVDYFVCPICEHSTFDFHRCVDCNDPILDCECDLGRRLAPKKDGSPRWRCVMCEEEMEEMDRGDEKMETERDMAWVRGRKDK